ncbi:MAG: transcription antitermination factor NusB [Deltaproteobacteria bacterium CG_4_8_14_3_um_filter_51_11]|nr:transcription antitermination factor NusB [bacterium]OIP42364.1 MAG: transcription antitermination factor NusB [Desulfobacteraceae bacterium CG2_30_51_40]PIP47526.1 MAG: transcription antitermination factor NusB [Deltaproteobacteria bacterium CG23_combo_of_CG06-09_8_20_14_all_51_20]PIW00453.1 MAG: transcription antitermination factor NusB [Deltaproteobacteria bacterium CG17_big_fil_post_rev_8_21_14_2_50_51_6]PIX20906.1 MAG: transcription antitermination factor NusB [Deltaproteobacteria bacte
MGIRRRARELAVQVLFHLEFSPDEPDEAFDLVCENFDNTGEIRPYAKILVTGVCSNRAHIDEMIGRASENWRIDRMAKVDRTILRLAVYEMLFVDEVPLKVSIDEAVEIGKKYGGAESSKFINGVLDFVYKEVLGGGESGDVLETGKGDDAV